MGARFDDLHTEKLKTLPKYFKKLITADSKEVVKKTMYSKLNTKVNNLQKKIPDATTVIYINQYNTDKQTLEKKKEYVNSQISHTCGLVVTTVFNTKIPEVKKKMRDVTGLMTTTVPSTKIRQVANNTLDHEKYIHLLAQYLIRN